MFITNEYQSIIWRILELFLLFFVFGFISLCSDDSPTEPQTLTQCTRRKAVERWNLLPFFSISVQSRTQDNLSTILVFTCFVSQDESVLEIRVISRKEKTTNHTDYIGWESSFPSDIKKKLCLSYRKEALIPGVNRISGTIYGHALDFRCFKQNWPDISSEMAWFSAFTRNIKICFLPNRCTSMIRCPSRLSYIKALSQALATCLWKTATNRKNY